MRPDCREMRIAGEEVVGFLGGKAFEMDESDPPFRRAVERGFEIMGEALTQCSKLDLDLAGWVPERRKTISFSNVLIDGYSTISDAVV